MKNENDLIPCDDELNRLKEFLADFKSRPKEDDKWSDHCARGDEIMRLLTSKNRQWWIGPVNGGPFPKL